MCRLPQRTRIPLRRMWNESKYSKINDYYYASLVCRKNQKMTKKNTIILSVHCSRFIWKWFFFIFIFRCIKKNYHQSRWDCSLYKRSSCFQIGISVVCLYDTWHSSSGFHRKWFVPSGRIDQKHTWINENKWIFFVKVVWYWSSFFNSAPNRWASQPNVY